MPVVVNVIAEGNPSQLIFLYPKMTESFAHIDALGSNSTMTEEWLEFSFSLVDNLDI